MADIREHLRRIEASAPPELWREIETRATQTRPDTEPSVIVFRPRGAQVRRRVAAGLLAAAVFALAAISVREATRAAAPLTKVGSYLPNGWEKCASTAHGYSIGYPGTWHTTDVFEGTSDPANACQWFSPDPFGPQGNVVAEGWGYPLELAIRGPFDDVRTLETDPNRVDVLVEEERFVQGHSAVRLEFETLVDDVGDTGLHYEYLIELDPETTLIVHTTETRGITGDYRESKTSVDEAVGTLRFSSPSA